MWRLFIKISSFSVATVFSLLSSVVILDLVTLTARDRTLLADLKLRVTAVQEFKAINGRIPEEVELPKIFAALPKSGPGYDYHITTGDVPRPCHREGPEIVWPTSGGWALWVWMGEFSEFYTSWDGRYSVNEPFSWFAVEGWFLFSPFIAIPFLILPFLIDRVKKGPNHTR